MNPIELWHGDCLELMKDMTLLETFRMVDVVNFLADLLNGGE